MKKSLLAMLVRYFLIFVVCLNMQYSGWPGYNVSRRRISIVMIIQCYSAVDYGHGRIGTFFFLSLQNISFLNQGQTFLITYVNSTV